VLVQVPPPSAKSCGLAAVNSTGMHGPPAGRGAHNFPLGS